MMQGHGEAPGSVRRQRRGGTGRGCDCGCCEKDRAGQGDLASDWPAGMISEGSGVEGLSLAIWHLALGDLHRWIVGLSVSDQ